MRREGVGEAMWRRKCCEGERRRERGGWMRREMVEEREMNGGQREDQERDVGRGEGGDG